MIAAVVVATRTREGDAKVPGDIALRDDPGKKCLQKATFFDDTSCTTHQTCNWPSKKDTWLLELPHETLT